MLAASVEEIALLILGFAGGAIFFTAGAVFFLVEGVTPNAAYPCVLGAVLCTIACAVVSHEVFIASGKTPPSQ